MSALAALPLSVRWSVAQAATQMMGLSNPTDQPMFVELVPDAMAPAFKYMPNKAGKYKVQVSEAMHFTGLTDSSGSLLPTPIWGYSDKHDRVLGATWPGKTFEVQSVSAGGQAQTRVKWENRLASRSHLLPVDTTAHWCYSLEGYEDVTIAGNGVPLSTHLHGGHTDFQFDGNPEFFNSPGSKKTRVVGPQWAHVSGGFTEQFNYDNNVRAGNLWYHDHALGITRLNVYAGLAGFYFVRDEFDTGQPDNPLGLPAWPFEKAYAIQDRMFRETGELFYPAFPGDPAYADFITGEGAILPEEFFPELGTNTPTDDNGEPLFTSGGPTALAEFFGDHMVVNGKIWPKEDVEARHYRLRLLNGTDSRFMGLRFRVVPQGATSDAKEFAATSEPLMFHVIGSDQGLSAEPAFADSLIFEPGSRYDVVVDFSNLSIGDRVIMENYLGDAPFGGDLPSLIVDDGDIFAERQTDRVMAFDIVPNSGLGGADQFDPGYMTEFLSSAGVAWDGVKHPGIEENALPVRKVALFEGTDEFGRLQPLLGTAEPTMNSAGDLVSGSIAWHEPTTESPALGSTEVWEIYNATGDAHPVHLHLVHFEILGREAIVWDSATNDDDRVLPANGGSDGTYMVEQEVPQHNGSTGNGFRLENLTTSGVALDPGADYIENAPKDMVTALPGQVTRIKATFDKPGRYVWHCHILSHEDHEMMRVLHVG